MRRLPRRRLLALLPFLGVGAWYAGLQWNGNAHTVVPGVLYRSGTLASPDFAALLGREHIRTVINLRGPQGGVEWYDREREAALRDGVNYVDLSWSAGRELTDDMVRRFYEVADSAKGPVLIHCRSGSDRTGLAVALYMAHVLHTGEEVAEAQLAIRFGHVSIPFLSQAYAMDATFERLEPSLGYLGS
ncbi:tyrosine-protein phosphatase [Aureimonas sp. ME7]|uniref:tyrosine-protein phosphatase n=1 Tax=Aureimonas sp. ME7 TaxID=2744252 RepID=UPI0015F49B50|nr:tyrosine-protein phosphatase [Aureimonas sp. ME7]